MSNIPQKRPGRWYYLCQQRRGATYIEVPEYWCLLVRPGNGVYLDIEMRADKKEPKMVAHLANGLQRKVPLSEVRYLT